jgi:hypothetical protein
VVEPVGRLGPDFDLDRSFAEFWVHPQINGSFKPGGIADSWLNANLRANRFIVDAYVSAKDILQFQSVHASADELNSAVQFGQGAKFTSSQLVVGVPKYGLSDETYVQYSRVSNPQLVATMFVSHSRPGDGVKAAAPQGTEAWTTIGVGLTANF